MQLRITSRKKLTSLLCALGLISIVAIYPRQTVNFSIRQQFRLQTTSISRVIARLNLSLFAFLPVTPFTE